MSLSSFLLKQTDKVDSELDALFKAQPPSRKRKLEDPVLAQSKRSKQPAKEDNEKVVGDNEDDEDNSDLEINYLKNNDTLVHESLDPKFKAQSKSKSKSSPKQKFVPADETTAQRDARTIFIGNLPLQVVQKRSLQKQLQKHILSFVPTAKIESVRFRSIPFSTPSTQQSISDSTTTPTTKSSIPISSSTSNINSNSVPITPSKHSQDRASTWRQNQTHQQRSAIEIETEKDPPKIHLTPSQKKKISFINQEFHNTASTVHAYIVFAHNNPQLQADRPKNLPPIEPCMDPYQAAKEAIKKVDGTIFLERMLRVDFVGVRGSGKSNTNEGGRDENEDKDKMMVMRDDPKSTLFVGNLELASKEEELRVFFDTLMKTERGEPPTADDDDDDDDQVQGVEEDVGKKKKVRNWVTKVRIIRDKDTQLGKGFAYVQFLDRECVDEILTMQPDQLKFAKRKLRVQRCKTIPGTKLPSNLKLSSSTSTSSSNDKSKSKSKHNSTSKIPTTPITIPKGDPTLGTKIAHLPKDERKQFKATDSDRIARRLAKKKARMVMGTDRDNGDKKDRSRVRKNVGSFVGGSKNDGGKGKKSRVRSERHLEKRNFKK